MGTALPKYRHICDNIIDTIKSGKLQPGMRTPSENDIMNSYAVSNTTARKALQQLEYSGWAKRIKGKGTFVRNRQVLRRATKILSFTKNMLEAGYKPRTEVITCEERKTGYESVIGGRKYAIPGPVYLIKRLRFGDDIPMLLETRYISKALCPDLPEAELNGSLYDLYWNRYGLELSEILQTLRPMLIDDETNTYFQLGLPAPALLIDGVTFCGKEIILEMESSVYRGDMYSFTVSATAG
jgi:GntR family transcriptional regulator